MPAIFPYAQNAPVLRTADFFRPFCKKVNPVLQALEAFRHAECGARAILIWVYTYGPKKWPVCLCLNALFEVSHFPRPNCFLEILRSWRGGLMRP